MDVNEFVDCLKRDKARGTIAPHQIILLIALYHIFKDRSDGNLSINITELNNKFQKVWFFYKDKFSSENNLLGMPLKALYNQKYLELNFKGVITDFRSISQLEKKISSIKLSNELIELFKISEVENMLKERFMN